MVFAALPDVTPLRGNDVDLSEFVSAEIKQLQAEAVSAASAAWQV